MTKMALEIIGLKEMISALDNYGVEAEAEIDKAVRITAVAVVNHATDSILTEPSVGVAYKRKGGKVHIASAPGQSPNSDTGELAGKIKSEKLKEMTYTAGTNVEYGKHLEYGTTQMAERPWLRPAIEAQRKKFKERIDLALKAVFK